MTTVQGEKLCGGCRITKPSTEFATLRSGRLDAQCKRCNCDRAKRHREAAGERGRAKRRADYAVRVSEEKSNIIQFVPTVRINLLRGLKRCSACLEVKRKTEFSLRADKTFHSSECKLCAKKRSKDWYDANSARACETSRINVLRKQVVLKLGSRCASPNCLVPGGCTDLRALQIDHVNNDGAEERKKYGIGVGPKGGQLLVPRSNTAVIYELALADTEGRYQLLCANCNVTKEHERRQEKYRQRREKRLAT